MKVPFLRLLLFAIGGATVGYLIPARLVIPALVLVLGYAVYMEVQLWKSRRRLKQSMAELEELMKQHEDHLHGR